MLIINHIKFSMTFKLVDDGMMFFYRQEIAKKWIEYCMYTQLLDAQMCIDDNVKMIKMVS